MTCSYVSQYDDGAKQRKKKQNKLNLMTYGEKCWARSGLSLKAQKKQIAED